MSELLLEKIAALEARIDALERRPPDRATMKDLRRCPSCGGAKLLRAGHIHTDLQANTPLALSVMVPRSVTAFVKIRGRLEAFACTKCGLVEWHALELEPSILEDADVELIEPSDDEAGPYR